MPLAKVDRDTGDLSPSLMLDSFAVAKAAVLAGDAIGLAPLTAIENELRAGKIALVPFDAPWLHLSYGLFYPRKKSLSRAAQLFVTQLRQVETALQVREQRAVARMNLKGKAQDPQGARRASRARARPRPASARKPRHETLTCAAHARAWLAAIACAVTSTVAAEAPGTLRLDYFHTGGRGVEIFAARPGGRRAAALAGQPGACRRRGRARRLPLRGARRGRPAALRARLRVDLRRVDHHRGGGRSSTALSTNRCASRCRPVPSRSRCCGAGDGPVASRAVWRTRCRPRGPVRAARAAATPGTDRHRAARRARRQGRPAAGRRRLHGRRVRGEVRARRTPHGRCAVPPRAVRVTARRLQRVGPVPAGRSSRASRARPPASNAARPVGATLRRVRLRALRAHLRQPRAARRRRVGAVRVHHHPGECARPTAAAASSAVLPRWRWTTTGPTTCSSTSSATTSPASPTSTTPRRWPTQPAAQVVEPWEANVTALLDGAAAQVARPRGPRTRRCRRRGPRTEFEARQREFQARRKQIRAPRTARRAR